MSSNTNTNTESTSRTHEIEFTLNGEPTSVTIPSDRTLVELLRRDCNLTGTTEGCGVGVCGSCTVLVDGGVVSSCLELAVNVDGCTVYTVEGLENLHDGPGLHPAQEAFKEFEALQCGYCTPGMLLTTHALLTEVDEPDRDDVERYLSENICRCTGYERIVDAVLEAAERVDPDNGLD